jgi:hypothetical protein
MPSDALIDDDEALNASSALGYLPREEHNQ